MSVAAVLTKPAPGAPMARPDALVLRTAHGIEGDHHAGRPGPRQVLVVAAESLGALGVTAEALRANVVVRGVALDGARSGSVLALGDARVRLTHRCEVCRALLPADLTALAGRRGLLGVVVAGGRVAPGDTAALEPGPYPEVPDGVFGRFAWIAAQIPPGRVMTYRTMLDALGGSRSSSRALPAYARRADAHRVVDSRGGLVRDLPGQAERLAADGVALDDVLAHGWSGEGLYQNPSRQTSL